MAAAKAVEGLHGTQQQLAKQHEMSRVQSTQRLTGQAAAAQALAAGEASCSATQSRKMTGGTCMSRSQRLRIVKILTIGIAGAPGSAATGDPAESSDRGSAGADATDTDAAPGVGPKATAELWAELDRAQRLLAVRNRVGDGVSAGDALEYAHRVSARCATM